MKPEEALAELKDSIKGKGYQCHKEVYEMAYKALEKQTPKKPIREEIGGGLHYLHCPNCGRKIIDLEWKQPYCWKCGSAIDWS